MGLQENDLRCEEQCFDDDDNDDANDVFAHDLGWESEELESLFLKEKEVCLSCNELVYDGLMKVARKEAVEWILRVKAFYGFTVLTCVLAVNYFDRFCSSVGLQKDKQQQQPWMSHLVAVACLSLAAKVEEIRVPLLLDLQVEECRYAFEAKTVQKMELLVLSTLGWRMNPVTPISFLDHIVRRFWLRTDLHWEFMSMCKQFLVSIIADRRFLRYLPSVIATAVILHVIKEAEPCSPVVSQNQLMDVLRTNQDEVYDCCKLILDVPVMGRDDSNQNHSYKRTHPYLRGSPDRVIDALFSWDSSNDSWIVASPVSYMPEPLFKRRKVQDKRICSL